MQTGIVRYDETAALQQLIWLTLVLALICRAACLGMTREQLQAESELVARLQADLDATCLHLFGDYLTDSIDAAQGMTIEQALGM